MIKQVSPVTIPAAYDRQFIEEQAGWQVVQSFELPEKADVWVCDLSHRPKAITLGPDLDKEGFPSVGKAKWHKTVWYARLKPNEGYYYNLLGELHDVNPIVA